MMVFARREDEDEDLGGKQEYYSNQCLYLFIIKAQINLNDLRYHKLM